MHRFLSLGITKLLCTCLLTLTATVAHAQFSFIDVIHDGDEGKVDGLTNPSHVLVSSDNKHVYVAGNGDNAIAVFERNITTGELTFVEAVKNGENGVDGLAGARETAISADGKYLYAVAYTDNAITTFSRNEDDGKLSFVEVIRDGENDVNGLAGAYALTISPDGDNIYVVANTDKAVSVFSVDNENGKLAFEQAIVDNEDLKLRTANGIVVSPDNAHVYVIGFDDDGVSVFTRNTSGQGRLTNIQNIDNWTNFGNVKPTDIVISNDGKNVYVAGYGGSFAGNITRFSRNQTSGKLEIQERFTDDAADGTFTGFQELPKFGQRTSVALNPDNTLIFTTGDDTNGDDYKISWFFPEPSTGVLKEETYGGIANGDLGTTDLELPNAMTFSKDGKFFYVVAAQEDAITTFSVLIPSITSFSPQEGFKNTEVTITGNDFGHTQGNSMVKFGDVTAEIILWSNTEIVAKVPEMEAGEVNINVTVNNFTHTSAEKFLVKEIIVKVKDFMPSSGKTGTVVTIKGTNFGTNTDERKVFFGDTEATAVQWISSDSLTAVVPAMEEDGAVKVKVMVNEMVGSSDADFIVDNTSPLGVLTYSDADRKVQTSKKIRITATFNEPIADEPKMKIAFKFEEEPLEVYSMTKVSETVYTYEYEVGEGDGEVRIQLQDGTDVHGNEIVATPENNIFIIDNTPPIPMFTPGDKTDSVATDAKITITFDEKVRNLDNSAIKNDNIQQIVNLTDTESNSIEYKATFEGQSITITPSNTLEDDQVYLVSLNGNTVEDEADNAVPDTTILFKTGNYEELSVDLKDSSLNQATQGTLNFSVETGTVVGTPQLYYRGICSCEDWEDTVDLELTSEDEYSYFLDNIADSIGIEYHYVFYDEFNNKVSDSDYIYKRYESGIDIAVQAGDRQEDYNIISFPLNLDKKNVLQVFDELGAYKKEHWRLYKVGEVIKDENPFLEYGDEFQNIEAGEAYLVLFKNQDISTINSGAGNIAEANKEEPYEISVHTGWNLIGNPFNFDIAWDSVVNYSGNEGAVFSSQLRAYSKNWDEMTNTLSRTKGGLIHVDEGTTSIKIPINARLTLCTSISNGRKKEEHKPKNNWEIPLNLNQGNGNIKRTIAGFGMHPAALTSRDKYDVMSPPHFGNYLDVNFHHPEYFYPKFAKDIVPLQDAYTWEFDVETNVTDDVLTLSWNEKDMPVDGKQIYLMDVSENKLLDMRSNYSYSFINSTPHAFKVFYGTQEFIEANVYPTEVHLHLNYPNPFYEQTTIPFTIPKSELGYHVKMRIYHISGKEVVMLKDELVGSGFHEIQWDGTDASGHKVKNGIYICELVAEEGGQIVKAEKRLLLLSP